MDTSGFSLMELFGIECETQCRILSEGLIDFENEDSDRKKLLETLMRAAHSLKGAARIVSYEQTARIAHSMEDLFVSVQKGKRSLSHEDIDRLLYATDLLKKIGESGLEDDSSFGEESKKCLDILAGLSLPREHSLPDKETESLEISPEIPLEDSGDSKEAFREDLITGTAETGTKEQKRAPSDNSSLYSSSLQPSRTLRVNADSLNQLLGSSAEFLVASKQLKPFRDNLWNIHRHQRKTVRETEKILPESSDSESIKTLVRNVLAMVEEGDLKLMNCINEMDQYERSSTLLSQRLYSQAMSCRMRPFSEITAGLQRSARDAARYSERRIEIEFSGKETPVDRDLLEQLESPLAHLIRNAVDHGLESPAAREKAGKSSTGKVLVHASHQSGFLVISVSDDGSGIDKKSLKQKILEKGLADEETVTHLSSEELLDFLFLPGFSLKKNVSDISGRGVGLDLVRTLAAQSRGTVTVETEENEGSVFTLRFPVSLSVMKALIFDMAGEAYAVPLARMHSVAYCDTDEIESVEGRMYFMHKGERIRLFDGAHLLGNKSEPYSTGTLSVLIPDDDKRFGVIVRRFRGESEIVIQPLDPRLGRVRNIAAAALTEDGNPVLLIDIDDFLQSMIKTAEMGDSSSIIPKSGIKTQRKRVLVVEDSLTVRELERKLITALGFEVETAVDGADGWNILRNRDFAAVVTDIDMPRMDGIELTRLIKNDYRLRSTPVIIVSYKDREEDRLKGLDAGADYYLTKGTFKDDRLARALNDLIGEPD